MLSIAICDDDKDFLQRAVKFVRELCEGQDVRIYSYDNVEILLKEAGVHPFDLALMDIQMPGKNGIEASVELLRINRGCKIIFLTAYLSYAQQVYDVEHLALVLKADMKLYLPKAFKKFLSGRTEIGTQMLIVESDGKKLFIPQHSIMYLAHHERSTDIYVENREEPITVSGRIEKLLSKLNPNLFDQTHKSFVVSWAFVDHFEKNSIVLKNGSDIAVSRRFKPIISEKIKYFEEHGLIF